MPEPLESRSSDPPESSASAPVLEGPEPPPDSGELVSSESEPELSDSGPASSESDPIAGDPESSDVPEPGPFRESSRLVTGGASSAFEVPRAGVVVGVVVAVVVGGFLGAVVSAGVVDGGLVGGLTDTSADSSSGTGFCQTDRGVGAPMLGNKVSRMAYAVPADPASAMAAIVTTTIRLVLDAWTAAAEPVTAVDAVGREALTCRSS